MRDVQMFDIEQISPGSRIGGVDEDISGCALDQGRKHLATASAEGRICIFSKADRQDEWNEVQTWELDGAPHLSKVCWCNPVYGQLLAVGSSTGEISLWGPETELWPNASLETAGEERTVYRKKGAMTVSGPVVAMEFAPREKGLRLAVASTKQPASDEMRARLRLTLGSSSRVFQPSPRGDGSWQLENEVDSSKSAAFTSLAWQPSGHSLPPMLLMGSHTDAKLWMYQQAVLSWQPVCTLLKGDVSNVAWANSTNKPKELIAIASKQAVRILGLTAHADKPQVEEVAEVKLGAAVRKVEWHPLASWLAASTVNSEIELWRPNLAGEWKLMQRLVGRPGEQMES